MITVQEEMIGPELAAQYCARSNFASGYTHCNYWSTIFKNGKFKTPRDLVLGKTPILDVARVPLLFLSDGRLYEGKHRMSTLANSPNIIWPFLVIRNWDSDEWPLPMGWRNGWKDGVSTKWWDFHKICYLAANRYYRKNTGPKMAFTRSDFD
jgi:hypothetical protein